MYQKYCQVRDLLGYKDSDVAKATGITKSTFSDWKNGRSRPKVDKIQKIAHFLNISPDYLLTGADDTVEEPTDVGRYINTILSQLRSDSANVMYYKGAKLTDMQMELLADDLENALKRVIKLSERNKNEK